MGFITETIIRTSLSVTPVAPILNFPAVNELIESVNYSFEEVSLNPVNLLTSTITNPILDIWAWLLFNLITPILLIVFLILFFVGQYYLIKLNITLIKYTFINIVKLVNFVLDSPRIKGFITTLKEELE